MKPCNHHFKTSYVPIYQGDSYKLVAVRVYPIGKDSFEVENINPQTNKRFSNKDFIQFIDEHFFNAYGYRGL
jgi:hypothetical protein